MPASTTEVSTLTASKLQLDQQSGNASPSAADKSLDSAMTPMAPAPPAQANATSPSAPSRSAAKSAPLPAHLERHEKYHYKQSDSTEQLADKERQRKDFHNMVERRRRYSMNDKIKELGRLLPQVPGCTEGLKQNKGYILTASVDYVKSLQRKCQDVTQLKERQSVLEENERVLLQRIKELELELDLRRKLPTAASLMSSSLQLENPCKRKRQIHGNCSCSSPNAAVSSEMHHATALAAETACCYGNCNCTFGDERQSNRAQHYLGEIMTCTPVKVCRTMSGPFGGGSPELTSSCSPQLRLSQQTDRSSGLLYGQPLNGGGGGGQTSLVPVSPAFDDAVNRRNITTYATNHQNFTISNNMEVAVFGGFAANQSSQYQQHGSRNLFHVQGAMLASSYDDGYIGSNASSSPLSGMSTMTSSPRSRNESPQAFGLLAADTGQMCEPASDIFHFINVG